MAEDHSTVLPPLPPSDPDSLSRNHYDANYGVRARDFWGENETHREELKPFQKCEHEFEFQVNNEIKCKRCHFGFLNGGAEYQLEIQNGKLFYKGEPLGI